MTWQLTCRLCDARLTRTFVDLGMSPLCESYLPGRQARRCRSVLSAARPYLRLLSARAAPGVRRPARRSSPTTPTSRRTPTRGSRTPGATRDAMIGAARPDGRAASSSRWPATTATCCSTSSAAGIPVLGIEPAANVAEAAGRDGRPDRRSSSSAPRPAREIAPSGTAGPTWSLGNNVLRPRARPQRLRRGPARCWSSRRASVTLEFPHLLRLIERRQFDTIYHEHFSYFSLLHRASRARRGARPARGRRRGAAHARRLAARLRAPRASARRADRRA